MISSRTAGGFCVLGLMLSARIVDAQAGAHYREFPLGADVASVSALAGVPVSQTKTIHQRPAILQDLQWRQGYSVGHPASLAADPVQQIVFSFYDDQLFRLVIDYDHHRTAGMTDADMVDAISTMYGSALTPLPRTSRAAASRIEEESGTRVARWGDVEYSAVLYSSSFYTARFRLIVTAIPLEALARTAEARALQLDEREAPQRELARQKKQEDETRISEEKAREANKAAFKP